MILHFTMHDSPPHVPFVRKLARFAVVLAVLIAVLGGVNPYGGYGRVLGVVLAVLSMQFLSSGLNMLQVSNFARELIWGALLIFVMVVNTTDWSRFGKPNPASRPVSKGGPVR